MHKHILPIVFLALTSCASTPKAAVTESALSDRLAVGEAVARFSDSINRHDWAALAGFFTNDAVWEASAGDIGFRYSGLGAIREGLVRNTETVEVLFQQMSPSVVDFTGPEDALARTAMTELLRIKGTGEVKHLFGLYTDALVRRDGRWRFVHRSFALRRALEGGTQ